MMDDGTPLSTMDKYNGLAVISKTEERLERLRRRAGFYLAPLAFGIVFLLPGVRLTPDGCRLSAVMACVIVLWLTESIPLPVTAMLGTCLCIGLGIADARTTLAPFADPIIFLFIGGV